MPSAQCVLSETRHLGNRQQSAASIPRKEHQGLLPVALARENSTRQRRLDAVSAVSKALRGVVHTQTRLGLDYGCTKRLPTLFYKLKRQTEKG